MEIKVPFLKQEIGAGDVVKAATGVVIKKPCVPCQQRAAALNQALRFVPRQQEWTKPPEVPEGWKMIRSCSTPDETRGVQLFHKESDGSYRIWNIADGEYRNAHTFCCVPGMEQQAIDKWGERCRSL